MMLFFLLKVRYNGSFQLFFVCRPAFNPHSIIRNYCGMKYVKSTIGTSTHRHRWSLNTSTRVKSQHVDTIRGSTHRHKSSPNSSTQVEGQHIDTSRESTHRHKSRGNTSTRVDNQHIDIGRGATLAVHGMTAKRSL